MDKRSIFLPPVLQIKLFSLAGTILLLAACAGMPRDDHGNDKSDETPVADSRPVSAEVHPDDLDSEVLFHVMAAERLISLGEYRDALDQYLDAAGISDDPQLARQATRLSVRLGDWSSALAGAARWLELAPDNENAQRIRILGWINTGQTESAVDALVELIDDHADVAEGWRRAATLMGAAEEDAHALKVMDALVERTGRDAVSPGVEYIQSVLLWQSGDLDSALETALSAAEESNEREHLVWAAQLAAENEQLETALELYRQARSERPDDAPLGLAEAEVLNRLDRPEQARELLRTLPENSEVLYTLGTYLLEADEQARAMEVWERLAALEGEDDASHHAFLVAHLAEMLEADEQALDWYERVESGPNQNRALLRRAVLEGRDGRLMQARNLLRSIRMAEDRDQSLIERSWLVEAELLREAGRAEEAVEIASEALVESPRSIQLLYTRALSAVAADDIDLAEQDLRRIIQMDAENAMALNALGYTLTDRTDRHQEAYRLIRRALEIDPNDPATLDSMGWVYYNLGEPEKALPYLERAFEAEDNPEIAAHVIEVLWELGRHEQAREVLGHALENYPDDDYLKETLERLGLPE